VRHGTGSAQVRTATRCVGDHLPHPSDAAPGTCASGSGADVAVAAVDAACVDGLAGANVRGVAAHAVGQPLRSTPSPSEAPRALAAAASRRRTTATPEATASAATNDEHMPIPMVTRPRMTVVKDPPLSVPAAVGGGVHKRSASPREIGPRR